MGYGTLCVRLIPKAFAKAPNVLDIRGAKP
jgi:hypothetical protein